MDIYRRISTSFSTNGDPKLVEPYMGLARKQVSMLVSRLKLGDLPTGDSAQSLRNGLKIKVKAIYGLTYVYFDTTSMVIDASLDVSKSTGGCVRICNVSDIAFDADSPTELPRNSVVNFTLTGIKFGNELQIVTSKGLWLDQERTLTIMDFAPCELPSYPDCTIPEECETFTFSIYTGSPCDPGEIHAYDSCGVASHSVTIEYIALEYDVENSADIIADNSFGTCILIGGTFPKIIEISGSGFWLDAAHTTKVKTLDSTSSNEFNVYTAVACGTGKITVTDDCGTVVSGGVRSVSGVWVRVYNAYGGIGGDGTTPAYPGGCPGMSPGVTAPLTAGVADEEAIFGGIKIAQTIQFKSDTTVAARKTFEEAVADCIASANNPPFESYSMEGSCFTWDPICMTCGECTSQQDYDYTLGWHGYIATGSWYYAYGLWRYASQTQIFEWRC